MKQERIWSGETISESYLLLWCQSEWPLIFVCGNPICRQSYYHPKYLFLTVSIMSFKSDLHLFRVAYLLVIFGETKIPFDVVTQGYFSEALVKCCKSILKQLLSHRIRFLCKAAHQLLFSITAICQVQDQIHCKVFALHNVWCWKCLKASLVTCHLSKAAGHMSVCLLIF